MAFFVAKGGPDACGPGCQEWIAAEGTIDSDAEPRLWELLRKLGERKLPVYFNSPGGLMAAGLELGRLMRNRGLTAGVGWTVPAGCDRQDPRDKSCDTLKRSGRELVSELDTGHALCASACVFTILGGVTRDVGAGAKLGIHGAAIGSTIMSADENGHIGPMPVHFSEGVQRKALDLLYEGVAGYLRKMGISPDLLTAARAISPKQVRFLRRDEIIAFGIDRREVVDGAWSFVDQFPGASAVKLIEAKDDEAGAFRTTVLRLSCQDTTSVRLQFERGSGTDGLPDGLLVTAAGRSFRLARRMSATPSDDRRPLEKLSAALPLAVLDDPAFVIAASEPSDQTPDSATGQPVHLTAQASAPVLGALARRCRSGLI
ncbi:MAG TPA: hypothetical protein VGH49_05325 [Xanthobacteraceae bacterium]